METTIKIYEIKHPAFRKDVEILVRANSMSEAIDKFKRHYKYDYDVNSDEIEGAILKYDVKVID